jgi:hypothetical protein
MPAEEANGHATEMPEMFMPETAKPDKTTGPEEQQIPVGDLSFRDTRELAV